LSNLIFSPELHDSLNVQYKTTRAAQRILH